jgi:hypothetical protein
MFWIGVPVLPWDLSILYQQNGEALATKESKTALELAFAEALGEYVRTGRSEKHQSTGSKRGPMQRLKRQDGRNHRDAGKRRHHCSVKCRRSCRQTLLPDIVTRVSCQDGSRTDESCSSHCDSSVGARASKKHSTSFDDPALCLARDAQLLVPDDKMDLRERYSRGMC